MTEREEEIVAALRALRDAPKGSRSQSTARHHKGAYSRALAVVLAIIDGIPYTVDEKGGSTTDT